MDQDSFTLDFLQFLTASPTSFHAVHSLGTLLSGKGFVELHEGNDWGSLAPGRYLVRRNDASLIALVLADKISAISRLRLAGAHTDSPGLKIKPCPVRRSHSLLQLGVEVYGGALLGTWFDRDLSLAGRIVWQDDSGAARTSLIDFHRPVAFIPSLAIHLNREANEQKPVNKQTDLMPVILQEQDGQQTDFAKLLADQLRAEQKVDGGVKILDHDLFLADCQPPALLGINRDFLTGGRLDNLLSCYALVLGLLAADSPQNCLVVLHDHEEVGSMSTGGAQGRFLSSVLERVITDPSQRQRCLDRSLFISVDNAHGVHPNFADRHDPAHLPLLNKGPVIKYNAGQRYATSGRTGAFYRLLAERAGIAAQEFVMRSDLACGSTIGPITAAGLGVATLDIGAPTLAMHSIRELAGASDAWQLARSLAFFFATPSDDPVWSTLG